MGFEQSEALVQSAKNVFFSPLELNLTKIWKGRISVPIFDFLTDETECDGQERTKQGRQQRFVVFRNWWVTNGSTIEWLYNKMADLFKKHIGAWGYKEGGSEDCKCNDIQKFVFLETIEFP